MGIVDCASYELSPTCTSSTHAPSRLNRPHLAAGQRAAEADKHAAIERFRTWAASLVEGARYMNVTSGPQIRQLLFAGVPNKNKDHETLEMERVFKVRVKSRKRKGRMVHRRVGEW